jgi:hypothetical protein
MQQPPRTIAAYLDTLPREQRRYAATLAHHLDGYADAVIDAIYAAQPPPISAGPILIRALEEAEPHAAGIPTRTRTRIAATVRHILIDLAQDAHTATR